MQTLLVAVFHYCFIGFIVCFLVVIFISDIVILRYECNIRSGKAYAVGKGLI